VIKVVKKGCYCSPLWSEDLLADLTTLFDLLDVAEKEYKS
jgi:hypothetical protein